MWRRRTFLGALLATAAPTSVWAGPRATLGAPFTVVLDPGHGGDNHGCQAFDGQSQEKEITLRMARELRTELRRRLPKAAILLTREDDAPLTLARRVEIANQAEASVFVSLHANASPTGTQHGFETYVLDAKASSLEAARTARRENAGPAVDAAPAQDAPEAARMVRQLELTAQRASSARLAHRIQAAQAERFPARADRGVKQARFDVLMGAQMPAVLFEAAFLDNPTEASLLRDASERARMVEGLAQALVEHYRERAQL